MYVSELHPFSISANDLSSVGDSAIEECFPHGFQKYRLRCVSREWHLLPPKPVFPTPPNHAVSIFESGELIYLTVLCILAHSLYSHGVQRGGCVEIIANDPGSPDNAFVD